MNQVLSAVHDFITNPSTSSFVWPLVGSMLVVCWFIYRIYKSLWVESLPNQWLLIIRNGKLLKAGLGLKTFIGPYDNVVRFSNKIQRISFSVNVKIQMQGVHINGFAFWSVYRDQDGPLKCYKYNEGGNTSKHVQTMCQSTLRSLVVNLNLDEILGNKNRLTDNMKTVLEDKLKEWGVSLESLEIAEARLKDQFEQAEERILNQQRLKRIQLAFELDTIKKKLQIEKLHDERTLQKYQIDSIERIYSKICIKDVISINQFVDDSKPKLASTLPAGKI